MRKADIVLAVLTVLALLATAVAGLGGERWTDERILHFTAVGTPLKPQGGAANGGGAHLNWTVPANSTMAALTVSIDFSGQAQAGRDATVTIRVTTPDGKAQAPITKSWRLPMGATSGNFNVNTTVKWAEIPEDERDTTTSGHGLEWSQPLSVVVIVEPPTDLPTARYNFAATAQGAVTSYKAS